MSARPLDRPTAAALVALGVIFAICGVGWAIYGHDIFLASLMAGLAGCL